jgi:pimeloyl-ACP methyl ester carboxylesterase
VISPHSRDTVIVVPGIGGDDSNYDGVCTALQDGGDKDCLQVFNWGFGWGLFPINAGSQIEHYYAEKDFVSFLIKWRRDHIGGRIVLIGHSAGAGVILGALPQLPADFGSVGPVIFLEPDVSPGYNLHPALQRMTMLHTFYSSHDVFWQGIGSSIFGTYDGWHEPGAGQGGFKLAGLGETDKAKLIQHSYQEDWRKLGNDGGHFDGLAHDFVIQVLKAIIEGEK